MHEAKKQAKEAMERKPRDREARAHSGSLGWELCALPKSDSSCVEKSSSGLGQWMSGRLWDVREGASCLCWGTLLHAVEPRQVTFLAGVSEFIVRAKAPPFPTLGLLPKRLCVPGTICTKVPHGDAHPSRGPGMEP